MDIYWPAHEEVLFKCVFVVIQNLNVSITVDLNYTLHM